MSHDSTFLPNQDLPVHRWFRYSAGYSGRWAEEEIARRCPAGGVVLDPFVGCGTTLVAAQRAGVASIGLETHPFVLDVARAKLAAWSSVRGRALRAAGARVVARARALPPPDLDGEPELLHRIYSPAALDALARLRAGLPRRDSPTARLVWLALVAVLRGCARVNTAPWQYVLPGKPRHRVADPIDAFVAQIDRMADDIDVTHRTAVRADARLDDARACATVADGSVDLVLTSPPYPNNFDYADATRIELTFLGAVARWADLHGAVRRRLVRSCSQHAASDELTLAPLLASDGVAPIRDELAATTAALADLRRRRAGRKTYDTMVAAYFVDMAAVWRALARAVRRGGEVCFVVGDSAPYGVHVPVERWLLRLAEAAGFAPLEGGFEPTRARNVKWKNRKHRVPLHEGRLRLRRE